MKEREREREREVMFIKMMTEGDEVDKDDNGG